MRLLLITLLAGTFASVSVPAEPKLRNYIAAIVNDAVITLQEVVDSTVLGEEGLRRLYWNKPEIYQQELEKLMGENLELLVERQLILQDFKASSPDLPESVVEDEIKRRIRERYTDRVNLTKELQRRGITYETYRQQVREEFITYIMRQRHVSSAIIISPAKIERYYATNVTNYKVGDQVKLRVIVLNVPTPTASADVRKLAQEIVAKMDAGTSFAEMAAVYSEGSQASQGGDWGWRDRSYLMKGLSDIAFALDSGQRSGIIGRYKEPDESYWIYLYDKTGQLTATRKYSRADELLEEKKFGNPHPPPDPLPEPQEYYLLIVENKRPAHVRPLAEVQDEIEKELASRENARLQKKWTDRLRAKAFVRYPVIK